MTFEKLAEELKEYGFYVCNMGQDYRTWEWTVCINIFGLWTSTHGKGSTPTEALRRAFDEAKARTKGKKLKTPVEQMMDNFVREGKTTRRNADKVIKSYGERDTFYPDQPKKKERVRLKKRKRVRLKS